MLVPAGADKKGHPYAECHMRRDEHHPTHQKCTPRRGHGHCAGSWSTVYSVDSTSSSRLSSLTSLLFSSESRPLVVASARGHLALGKGERVLRAREQRARRIAAAAHQSR
eukprot:6880828-Prymnesium_polylepis.1